MGNSKAVIIPIFIGSIPSMSRSLAFNRLCTKPTLGRLLLNMKVNTVLETLLAVRQDLRTAKQVYLVNDPMAEGLLVGMCQE